MPTLSTVSLVIVTALASVLGGVIVVQASWSELALNRLMALGAGFLLALSLLELLPEVLVGGGEAAALASLAGFLAVFTLERVFSTHFHFGEETHPEKLAQKTASLGALTGMLVHSFFDGFSIAAGFEADFQLGLLVFFAVLLHKVPDGLTISSLMLAAFNDRRRAFLASISFAAATVAGALVVWVLAVWQSESQATGFPLTTTTLGLAVSAGVFLYVVGSDLLPAVTASEDRRVSLYVLIGVAFFYLVEALLHPAGL